MRDMSPAQSSLKQRFLRDLSELTCLLNNLLGHLVPLEVMVGTEHATRRIGRQPEHDYGNCVGSMLRLAMLRPLCFGNQNGPPLRLLGSPPPETPLRISSSGPQSSQGIDNHRCNILESLVLKFEEMPWDVQAARVLHCLLDVWCQCNVRSRTVSAAMGHRGDFTQTVPLWLAAPMVLDIQDTHLT